MMCFSKLPICSDLYLYRYFYMSVSAFVSVTLFDVFKETSGRFPAFEEVIFSFLVFTLLCNGAFSLHV